MPDTYLFDIGNVIIAFDFNRTTARLEEFCTVAPEDALALVGELTDQLELGQISPDEFFEEASAKIGYRGEIDLFRTAFEDIFDLNERMVNFIEEKKAEETRLFLLSNTNGIHVPFFEKTYPVFGMFDDRIYSHEVGLMKPNPAIFDLAIEKFGLVPEETIYIDDRAENCEAGREAGLLAIQYDHSDHAAFLKAHAELGV